MPHHPNSSMHDRVTALEPQMDYICQVSSVNGLSVSVLSGGKEAYAKYFGFRDLEAQEAPDGDTTCFIGSVTKGMVASLVGLLVEEGMLAWSTRVTSILAELQDSFDGRGSQIIFVDILSHRTGLARSDPIWVSRAGNFLLLKLESMRTWVSQPVIRDFRTDFLYNYACDVVAESLTWLSRRVLKRFSRRKYGSRWEDLAGKTNAAKAY